MPTPPAPSIPRPIAVTILGWVFLVFSAFNTITSVFVLVLTRFISRVAPDGAFPPQAKDFPPGFEMLISMFQYFNEFLVLQTLVAAFSVYAALRFLKLRAWSRSYFEALNWVALASTIAFGVYFALAWDRILSGIPTPNPSATAPPPEVFGALGVFTAIFATLFNAVFPVAIIWLLRSRFVRPAFLPPASGDVDAVLSERT